MLNIDKLITSNYYIHLLKNTKFDIMCIMALLTLTSVVGGLSYLVFCAPTDDEIIKRKRKEEINNFNKSFVTDLENIDERELSENELKGLFNCELKRDTPFGKVIIKYNHDTESYWYYADNKNIPYLTLDALAREFAVTYDCKIICVNYKEEWEKSKSAVLAEKYSDELNEKKCVVEKKDPDDVFANFKSYNTNKTRKDSIKRRRYRIMTEKSNQFSYKGKLNERKLLDKPISSCNKKKFISFSEYNKQTN